MNHHSTMITLLKFSLIFSIGTFLGWTLELLWRRFLGLAKRWINPGFLSGPWLPLYGFGTIALYLLCDLHLSLPLRAMTFLLAMTLLEYIAGLIFTSYFRIRLWDYSDQWGNLQGIICPLYSLLWTSLGLIFYYSLYPLLQRDITILLDNLEFSFFVGAYAGLFSMDLWQSFNLAGRIKKIVNESEVKWHVDFEKFKLELQERVERGKKMYPRFFLPFYGEMGASLRERVGKHKNSLDLYRLNPLKGIKNGSATKNSESHEKL